MTSYEKRVALSLGHVIITSEKGKSMEPLIMSGQRHVLTPTTWEKCKVDDIVFCKVEGKYYTHKVLHIEDKKGLLIGNNKGRKNGWTKLVYGKVTSVLNPGKH